MSSYRKIMIRGEEWGWMHGYPVLIRDPKGKTHKFMLAPLDEKHSSPITPGYIADVINRKIIGYSPQTGFPKGVLPYDHTFGPVPSYHRLSGPRGTWWVRVSPFVVSFFSPEGIEERVSPELIFGESWVSKQMERLGDFSDDHPRIENYTSTRAFIDDVALLSHPRPDFSALRKFIREEYGA